MNYKKIEDFNYLNKRFACYVDDNGVKYLAKKVENSQYDLLNTIANISKKCASLANIEAFFKLDDDNFVYLTQIYEYDTLDDLIKKHEYIDKSNIIKLIKQVIDAIKSLHDKDILHRDIKPANILVSDEFDVYVIDFDISRKFKKQKSEDTTLFGTRGFAAPEQYGFTQTTKQSDIYALGKTIEVLVDNCYDTFDYELQKIIKKATKLDPSERYQDISEILNVFSKYSLDNERRAMQVKKGLEAGLSKEQVSLYINDNLDDKQMGVIKHALLALVPVDVIKFMARGDFNSRQLWQIKQASIDMMSLEQIKIFAKSYYTPEEMGIIRCLILNDFKLEEIYVYIKYYNYLVDSKLYSEEKLKLIRKSIYHGMSFDNIKIISYSHLEIWQMENIIEILQGGQDVT